MAEAAGVSVNTITRKIQEIYPDKMKQGKRTRLTQKEAIAVMKATRKINFVGLPQNEEELPQTAEVNLDKAFQAALITLANLAQNLDSRVSNIENKIATKQVLLPAPALKPRDHINMIVRETAKAKDMSFQTAWSDLYRHFGYRTKTNPTLSAKNRSMGILDYIEAEGMIETLQSVAIEWGK
jgi:hypothetical protein